MTPGQVRQPPRLTSRMPSLGCLLTCAAMLALVSGGCAERVKLRSIYDVGEQQVIEEGRAAVITKGRLQLIVRQAEAPPIDGEELLAVEIELYNGAREPVTIFLDDAEFLDDRGVRRRPMDPRRLERLFRSSGMAYPWHPRPEAWVWRGGGGGYAWRCRLGVWPDYCAWAAEDPYLEQERDQSDRFLAALWRAPIVEGPEQVRGVLVFHYPLRKREVFRLHFRVRPVRPTAEGPQPLADRQPIPFEFLFYGT